MFVKNTVIIAPRTALGKQQLTTAHGYTQAYRKTKLKRCTCSPQQNNLGSESPESFIEMQHYDLV